LVHLDEKKILADSRAGNRDLMERVRGLAF